MIKQKNKIQTAIKLIEEYISLYENDLKNFKLTKREIALNETTQKELKKILKILLPIGNKQK